jgi:hypothetical protein
MKKKRGRPPSRPKNLVVFNVLLTPEAKARLKALAQIEHTYAYTLLEGAFWKLWEELPPETRQAADTVAKLVTGEPSGKSGPS